MPDRWDRRRRSIAPEAAEASLTRSLRALRTDWVDILFLHEPLAREVESVLRLAEWLLRQKASGRVRYLGLAGHAPDCVAIAGQTDGLFDVLQVEDSLAGHEADVVIASGRPLQVTFGYVRKAAMGPARTNGLAVVRAALQRNRQGMVLVSSRLPERLRALAALGEADDQSHNGS
jgi:aryl-alcohol dehydrogenase-like predicted oxidoreductase